MIEISILSQNEISVSIEETKPIEVRTNSELLVIGDYESYEGEYSVTPKAKKQSLKTKNKYLIDDVTVEKIPYFEVSNEKGGFTVTIG